MRSEPQRMVALVWALSRPLAATWEITFVFFSSGYLDVSVRRVPLHALFGWRMDAWGVPMRVSPFRHLRLITGICPWPQLFAAYHVFHRLSVPRHPPCALSCLTWPASFGSGTRFHGLLLGACPHKAVHGNASGETFVSGLPLQSVVGFFRQSSRA